MGCLKSNEPIFQSVAARVLFVLQIIKAFVGNNLETALEMRLEGRFVSF